MTRRLILAASAGAAVTLAAIIAGICVYVFTDWKIDLRALTK